MFKDWSANGDLRQRLRRFSPIGDKTKGCAPALGDLYSFIGWIISPDDSGQDHIVGLTETSVTMVNPTGSAAGRVHHGRFRLVAGSRTEPPTAQK